MKSAATLTTTNYSPCFNVQRNEYELEAYSQMMALNMESIQLLESLQKELNRRIKKPQTPLVLQLLDKSQVHLLPAEPQFLLTEVGDILDVTMNILLTNKRYLPMVDHELLVEGLVYLIGASDYAREISLSYVANKKRALIVLEHIQDIQWMEEEIIVMEQVMEMMGGKLIQEHQSIVLSFQADDKFS